jgi:hypothetical protein
MERMYYLRDPSRSLVEDPILLWTRTRLECCHLLWQLFTDFLAACCSVAAAGVETPVVGAAEPAAVGASEPAVAGVAAAVGIAVA